MQLKGKTLRLSASDLVDFLACSHLTALEVDRAHGQLELPVIVPGTAELVARKGEEYERGHLEQLRVTHGDALVEISSGGSDQETEAAVEQTVAAMSEGAPVIYQAALRNGNWIGFIDFLERVDLPSSLGAWSYEPADTKLARSMKPYFVTQLSLYAELIAAIQQTTPKQLHVILGDGSRADLVTSDFSAYFRRMKATFEAALANGLGETYPEPVEHCALCRWDPLCTARRIENDHLSLVARLGRPQAESLRQVSLTTVVALASASDEQRPEKMATTTFGRLRSQASLQVKERETGELELELLRPALIGDGPLRGFARLPRPSPGDVFFDIEGDPLFGDDGLEYLWGATVEENGTLTFKAFWGLDAAQEKQAFEQFVDFVLERRARHPDMHVYHYAPYERTALTRMMGKHATREDDVDRLLREHILVDLYRVVEESIRISRPSYSLKEVEAFYMTGRAADVKQAGDSIVAFEEWIQDGDSARLDAIEAYNHEDCDSTKHLLDWLLLRREEAATEFEMAIPWRAPGQPVDPQKDTREEERETAELQAELLERVPDGGESSGPPQHNLWLLAQLLGYHQREAKPGWWKWYDRLDKGSAELREFDSEALGDLFPLSEAQPLPSPSRSFVQHFSYSPQEHKVSVGQYADPESCQVDPQTGESDHRPKRVAVERINDQRGEVTLRLNKAAVNSPPRALVPTPPIPTEPQRGALRDLARTVIADGLDDPQRFRAATALLERRLPRTSAVEPGTPLQVAGADLDEVELVVRGLEDSFLFIQGPPGAGKTYTGARLIVDLIASGKKVGVTANTHKAINKLLEEVERAAVEAELNFSGLKKSGTGEEHSRPADLDGAQLIGNSKSNGDFGPDADLDLRAGTAWLWCRQEMRETVDYLIIDEAGQVSLADSLAISTATRNVILLGDPLQLAQVSQGTHPPGSGVSVLEHLLADEGTVARDRGIFLEQSHRMHPAVCEFVSDAFYQGRLRSAPGCERQLVDAPGILNGTGVRSLSVTHHGNSRRSPEEADLIAEKISVLLKGEYVDQKGDRRPLVQKDVMVVTPYNAQVRELGETMKARGLSDVTVGTVDKFQGREAAVVFFSMATSSGAEIPRNVEFLYSRNRLNVAISRARCLAVLVASPELMTIACRTVEQMRLVNSLCLLDEMGQVEGSGHNIATRVG